MKTKFQILPAGLALGELRAGEEVKPILAVELKSQPCAGAGRAPRWLGPCLLGILLFSTEAAHGATAAEAWVRRYDSGQVASYDNAYKLVADTDGNVIVAGHTYDGITGTGDMLNIIIKYSGAGVAVWTNRYDGGRYDYDNPLPMAVDSSGNVFVTGSSWGSGGFATIAYSGTGVALWTNRYDRGFYDYGSAIAVDHSGNVFVTGSSLGNGGYWDYVTVAYSGAGVALWTNRYNGPGNGSDQASAIAVDHSGNVFVTGSSWDSSGGYYDYYVNDYATIAYSGAGVALWTNRYNGPGNWADYATAIAVDNSGNVFVTGSSYGSGGNYDYATIAYSGAGVALWTNRYNGPGNSNDLASAVAVDSSGNVFVTGSSTGSGGNSDYARIAYSGAGVALWTNRSDGGGASAIAVDHSGNVFVTGTAVGSGGNYDYATIAYSGAGVPLWTNRYDGPGNYSDRASAIAVDSSGNVFVTGTSWGGASYDDYATIAYSGAGVALWTNCYNGLGNSDDFAAAVAVDHSGNVFVTGSSWNSGINYDYATIAYSGAGVALWTNRYNGPGNSDDQAAAVALDHSGNVFVTGTSGGDYATIAYSGAGVALWTNRYDGGGASAIAVDHSGNVFVTGSSGGDYATIAYSGAGVALWTNRYNGPGNGYDQAFAVAVDHSGNVFVTGYSYGSRGYADYLTIAYSGAGVPLWTNRYDGPGNGHDQAFAVAVDHSGNVFVTGDSDGIGGGWDYATIAYSGAGVALWTNRYNGGQANAVAVDSSGNVFVTGTSWNAYAYVTIAYSATGVALWTNRYDGPGKNSASAIAVDSGGNVYVTGGGSGLHIDGGGEILTTPP